MQLSTFKSLVENMFEFASNIIEDIFSPCLDEKLMIEPLSKRYFKTEKLFFCWVGKIEYTTF